MEKITRHARVDVADALRGLAVLGIILLHSIEHFNFGAYPDTSTQPLWLNFTDSAIWDGLFFMFGGKAYAVFALLFGFSFFIQDDNQRLRGNDFRKRFCWRLTLLFIIGNINAMFFTGEVLVLFSIVGLSLVAVCRMKTRTVLWIAAICLLQPVEIYYIVRGIIDPAYMAPTIPWQEWWRVTYEYQSSGNFWQMAKVNLWEGQLFSLGWAWDNGRFFQTAGIFMLGMLIGRNGWFLRDKLHRWAGVLGWSIAGYFPLSGLASMLPEYISNQELLRHSLLVLNSLSKFCFMMMLVSAVLYLWYRTNAKKMLAKLIPYGKMSMTNYVTQSIIGSFLFYNWGLGLYRYLGITASVFVGAAIFIVQLYFCRWWLKAHSHGPFEHVWKRLTWLR